MLTGSLVLAAALGALDSSTLDSGASSLSAATTVLTVGSSKESDSDDGHDHDHGGGGGQSDDHVYWSAVPSTPSTYTVSRGTKLSFKYSSYHNVFLLPTQSAFDSCTFTSATMLANQSHGGGSGSSPNLYEAVATEVGTLYVACEVTGHCGSGQKITIFVNDPPPPASPPTQNDSNDVGGMVGGIVGGMSGLMFGLIGFGYYRYAKKKKQNAVAKQNASPPA